MHYLDFTTLQTDDNIGSTLLKEIQNHRTMRVIFFAICFRRLDWTLFKQECIPVGCVPPARYRTGVSLSRGVSVRGSLSRGSLSGGLCLGGLCLGGVSGQGGLCLGGVSVQGGLPDRDPFPREQNDWQTGVKTLSCNNFVADGIYTKTRL